MTALAESRHVRRPVAFRDIAENITERVDDPRASGLDHYVGLEHLDPDTLKISRWGSPSDVEATKLRFYPGDVIYARRRAYQRKLGVAEWDGIASAHALVLRARPDICLPEFLPYFLQSEQFHRRAMEISVGSLSPTINWTTLAVQEFVLPLLDEQTSIVEILRSAMTVRERYLDARRAASSHVEAMRTEFIDADRLGGMTRLGDFADVALGRVYPSHDYKKAGIRLLRPGNIAPSGYVEWAEGATVFLPEHYAAERGSVSLLPGDIVMNLTAQSLEDGFLGRVCLAREGDESIVNQRIARVRGLGHSTPYLFRVLQHRAFRRHVEQSAKGSKIKHLYWRDLAKFEIPTPSPSRMAEVVERISAAEQVLIASATAASDADRLLRTTREWLLLSGDSRV